MTHVVTVACIGCEYTDCVDVCPADCFREGPNFLLARLGVGRHETKNPSRINDLGYLVKPVWTSWDAVKS